MVTGFAEFLFIRFPIEMKHYLPAFLCVLLIYIGGYLLFASLLSKWEEEAEHLNRTREEKERLTERMRVSQRETEEVRERIVPWQEFHQAWYPFLEKMNLAEVLKVLDEMTMQYGLGVSRKGTAQRQDASHALSAQRMQVITLNVTGEYTRACQFLHDLSLRMPLLRVDTLRIRSSGTGRIDVGLQLSFPEL